MDENPIKESINYLVNAGWSKEEAKNLIKALYHEDAKTLWDFAPEWIELVADAKKNLAMYDLVAKGIVNVTKHDNAWFYQLNDEGLKVGQQMFGE
jgi:hypothetical protein